MFVHAHRLEENKKEMDLKYLILFFYLFIYMR